MRSWVKENQPSRCDVGLGVSGDGPDSRAGRGVGGYALDGEEGGLAWTYSLVAGRSIGSPTRMKNRAKA